MNPNVRGPLNLSTASRKVRGYNAPNAGHSRDRQQRICAQAGMVEGEKTFLSDFGGRGWAGHAARRPRVAVGPRASTCLSVIASSVTAETPKVSGVQSEDGAPCDVSGRRIRRRRSPMISVMMRASLQYRVGGAVASSSGTMSGTRAISPGSKKTVAQDCEEGEHEHADQRCAQPRTAPPATSPAAGDVRCNHHSRVCRGGPARRRPSPRTERTAG